MRSKILFKLLSGVLLLLLMVSSPQIAYGQEDKLKATINGENILDVRGQFEGQTTYSFLNQWFDFPKPYSRDLVVKNGIRSIEFWSRTVINDEELPKINLVNAHNLPTIKFSYSYNKKGDLLQYAQYKILQKEPKPILQCQLIKKYDNKGLLTSWHWIAPPIDSMAENHTSHLDTPMEIEFGSDNKRVYIQRNSKGQEVAEMLVKVEPKYIGYKPGRSRYKGFINSYWLKTTTYNSFEKKQSEIFLFPDSDSATLYKNGKPWRFVNYEYSTNQQLLKRTEAYYDLNSGKNKDWIIEITNYSNKHPNRIEKIETYEVKVRVADSTKAQPFLMSGRMMISKENDDQLHPAIQVKHKLIFRDDYSYDEQSRIIQYSVKDNYFYEPFIIIKDYQDNMIIEKGYLPDDNYYLVKKFNNGLLTNEFYATGFLENNSSTISQFFKNSRNNSRPGGYKNQVAKANFDYKNNSLQLVTYDYKHCLDIDCYKDIAHLLSQNDFNTIFSSQNFLLPKKKVDDEYDEEVADEEANSLRYQRQQLFNFKIRFHKFLRMGR